MSSLTAAIINTALAAYFDITAILNSTFLPLAGGSLSGPLLLSRDPIIPQEAATKNYVDTLPGGSLSLTGGTMAGVINMNSNRILGLPVPLVVQEPATKGYVDNTVGIGTSLILDQSGGLVTTGVGAAFNLATNVNYTTYVDGLTLSFIPHVTSIRNATLNPNGLGAKALQIAPGVPVPDGWLRVGCPVTVVYSAAADAFVLRNANSQDFDILVGDTKFSYQTADHGRWFLADGRTLSRTDPTTLALFNLVLPILGTGSVAWGSGDGSTTFNLLDGRGRVLASKDGGTGRLGLLFGQSGGQQTVQLQQVHLPSSVLSTTISAGQGSHNHTGSTNANTDNSALSVTGPGTPAPSPSGASITIDANTLPAMSGTTPLGGSDAAHSNVQPTVVANMFVRY
jgi:microcystin-dependent protein